MCHYALKFAKPGDIIVVDCGGSTETGYWGEIMSLIAIRKELGGLVNDGGVRDRSDLRKLKFPIFSKSVFPGGTVKYRRGFINRFIACGGVLVCPGDIIIGDGDGVVVVPLKEARNILKRAKAILKREIALKKQISSGKELFRLFGFSEIH
jgi:4-hydroxy-4-methyl-2-oxoglutarate aldolase